MFGANRSNLNILDGLFLEFSSIDLHEKKWDTKQLYYIEVNNLGRTYLSMKASEQLGVIGNSFPSIGASSTSSINEPSET